MMSNIWIISSSDSDDDDLPSFSTVLRKKITRKHEQFKNVHGLDATGKNIKLDEKESEHFNAGIQESPNKPQSVVNREKNVNKPKTCKNMSKKSSDLIVKSDGKLQNHKLFDKPSTSTKPPSIKPEDLFRNITCFISKAIVKVLKSQDIVSNIVQTLPVVCRTVDKDASFVSWTLASSTLERFYDKENFENLNQMLLVIAAENLMNLIQNEKSSSSKPTLADLLHFSKLSNSTVHIACFGLKNFKQFLKKRQQQEYKQTILDPNSKPIKQKNGKPNVSLYDIPDLFTDIQLTYGINVLLIENETQFIQLLTQITKAIAEAPMKRCQRKDVLFVNGPSCVKIDANTGEGSKKAWKMMLEQMFNVSSDISSSISSHYPSFNSLMQAYQSVSPEEGLTLLSEILVRRGFGSLQQSRRVGPELSKRIYKFLQTQDKDEVI